MVMHSGTGINLKSSSNKYSSVTAHKAKCKKEVKTLKRVNVRSFIELSKGKFLSIKFIKQNGDVRKITGRVGVTSYLKGGVNKVERLDRPYVTLFDIQSAQYRTVNLDTVSEIRADGCIWQVV